MSTQAYPDYSSFQGNLPAYGGMPNGLGGMGWAPPPNFPSSMELTQLNQPLLTPYLASAFSIPLSDYGSQDPGGMQQQQHQQQQQQPYAMGGLHHGAGGGSNWAPQNSGGSEGNGYTGPAHHGARRGGSGRDGGGSSGAGRTGGGADDEISRLENGSGTGQVGPAVYS